MGGDIKYFLKKLLDHEIFRSMVCCATHFFFFEKLVKLCLHPTLFVTEITKFKAKDSEIVTTPLCLGNISEDFSKDNIKNLD